MTALAKLNDRGGWRILAKLAGRFGLSLRDQDGDGRPMHRPAGRDVFLLPVSPELSTVALRRHVELDCREYDYRRPTAAEKVDYITEELRQAARSLRGQMLATWLADRDTGLPMLQSEAPSDVVDALADLIRMVAQDDHTLLERAGSGLLATFERATKERP